MSYLAEDLRTDSYHSHKAQVLIFIFFPPLGHGLFGGAEIRHLPLAFPSKGGEQQGNKVHKKTFWSTSIQSLIFLQHHNVGLPNNM